MSSGKSRTSSSRPTQRPRAGWRDELYVIIFEADTRAGQLFDVALLIAIILSITIIALETVESFEQNARWMRVFQSLEWILTLLFTAEYIARLICVQRPLRYALSFFGIIDLLACLPLYLTLMDVNSKSLMIVRSIRLLRVFRVLKMMRMLREAHNLKSAVWNSRDKIAVFIAVVMVAVTISGTVMYHVEHIEKVRPPESALPSAQSEPQNSDASAISALAPPAVPANQRVDQFTSIPQSMYWAIVTMTTVGYGDIVPRTTVGKAISAALILLGYSLIIVPTGFVSAEIHAQTKQRSLNTRTCPHCLHEGHAPTANYCAMCGKPLVS